MEENNNTSFAKRFWKNIMLPIGFWLFLLVAIITTPLLISTKHTLDITHKALIEMSEKMSVTGGALNKQTYRADSMNKILNRIAKYMPIASSLQYRDSVFSKLPYSTGDIVRMKPDSSKWVIVCVSVSGSKWQHKVSYTVRDSSRKEITVEPETIY